MKILVISNLYPPHVLGGYEIGCFTIARELASRGHDLRILTSSTRFWSDSEPPFVDRRLELNDYHIDPPKAKMFKEIMMHRSRVSCYHNVHQLVSTAMSFRPDVIYVFNLVGLGGLNIVETLNLLGIPWVWHLMDEIPRVLLDGSKPEVLSLFNATGARSFQSPTIISMSKNLIQSLANKGVSFSQEINIVPGWVVPLNSTPRASYGEGKQYKFISAGALEKKKGIDLIIEAASRLKAGDVKNFSVDLFGAGESDYYVEQAAQLNVLDLIHFRGSVSHEVLQNKFKEYDCFLFPTHRSEPFGFVPIEAAAQGCVPILTRECGASERLVDKMNCLKIERTAEALAIAMNSVTGGEVNLAQLGTNAVRSVRQDLSLDNIAEQVVKILKCTAASERSPSLSVDDVLQLQYLKDQFSTKLLLRNLA
jgi:glycogen synthase